MHRERGRLREIEREARARGGRERGREGETREERERERGRERENSHAKDSSAQRIQLSSPHRSSHIRASCVT